MLLYLAARIRGEILSVARSDWGRFLFAGAFGIALTYGLYYNGLANTTATESTLVIVSEPILIAFAARILLGERLTRIQELGQGIGFLGVHLIIAQGVVFQLTTGVLANVLIIVALACAILVIVGVWLVAGLKPPNEPILEPT